MILYNQGMECEVSNFDGNTDLLFIYQLTHRR